MLDLVHMLEIRGVGVNLAGRAILGDVSLQVQAGQMLAICGPNGAGKSTLLRAVLGEIPYSGRVHLNGQDIAQVPLHQMAQQRAVLAQETHVAFAFTVGQIVDMGAQSGANLAQGDITAQALHAVGLAGYSARTVQTLSGGERQRVHLARALAQVWQPIGPSGPRWLFLDEPVASLDLGHQLDIMQLARSYADAGGGVVAVMHDLNLSAKYADQIAFLDAGQLSAFGAPADVLTGAQLRQSYRCTVKMNTAPQTGPWFVPQCAQKVDFAAPVAGMQAENGVCGTLAPAAHQGEI